MKDKKNYSSREVLNDMVADSRNSSRDEQKIFEMVQQIERNMEQFDREKREISAKSVEDLSKIVITA